MLSASGHEVPAELILSDGSLVTGGKVTKVFRRAAGTEWVPYGGNTPYNPAIRCRVITSGHVIKVSYYEAFPSFPSNIKRLDKDHYINLLTDEVGEYEHGEHYGSDRKSFFKSLELARGIINTNIRGEKYTKFITLTYDTKRLDKAFLNESGAMTDLNKLHDDFRKFIQKFKRWSKSLGRGELGYITAVEPQQSGTWHCHMLPFWKDSLFAPFIPVDKLSDMWGQGFVFIQSLENVRSQYGDGVDNIGAYITSYITDFKGKKYSRLPFYPSGCRPFRWSRNVTYPEITDCKLEDLFNYVDVFSLVPTYRRSYDICNFSVDDSGLQENTNALTVEYYNLVRKASQV